MKYFLSIGLTTFLACGLASSLNAQTANKAAAEVNDLRGAVVAAIKRLDRKKLETILADDFTHTHASGKVDGRAKRLDTLLSGETTIESAEADDLKISIFGKNTAVATGQSSIVDGSETARYRWTVVYAKIGRTWQIAASQATKLP